MTYLNLVVYEIHVFTALVQACVKRCTKAFLWVLLSNEYVCHLTSVMVFLSYKPLIGHIKTFF